MTIEEEVKKIHAAHAELKIQFPSLNSTWWNIENRSLAEIEEFSQIQHETSAKLDYEEPSKRLRYNATTDHDIVIFVYTPEVNVVYEPKGGEHVSANNDKM